MVDYQIQSGTRTCCITGKVLTPGETFYSALCPEGAQLVRRDYSREAWHGPPEGAVGYWQARIPEHDSSRRPVIDDDVLMECFMRLEGATEPGQLGFRYVVALLLMRRKRLKFEDVDVKDGREVLSLRCTQTRAVHEVVNPGLSDSEIGGVQDEVNKMLGWR
jgi:hypothetical protein